MKNVAYAVKTVFVNAYERLRFGKIEFVRDHWRSYPMIRFLA